MLEFLISQNSSEDPTFLSILMAVLSSFFLSFLIVITYEITTRDLTRSANFTQSLALISIVAATVMQAIGDSLARGLGMLGALAIIRFRTRLDNPRNMTFMFASLAVGISCGVFGFTIAFVGTAIFCLAAILIRFSKFMNASDLIGNVRFSLPFDISDNKEIEVVLARYCTRYKLDQYRVNTTTRVEPTSVNDEQEPIRSQVKEMTYNLVFKDSKNADLLLNDLNHLPYIQDIRIRFNTAPNDV